MAGDVSVSGGKVRTPVGDAPVLPLLLLGIGGYLMWYGVHYWRSSNTRWASDPVKSVLQGKGLPQNIPAGSAETQVAAYEGTLTQQQAGGGGGAPQGTLPAGPLQNTAKLLLGKYGWGVDQMAPLIRLWTQESGWSSIARNRSSGAFGVAQALGHGEPGTAAPDGTNEYGAQYGLTVAEAQAANAGSGRWQIEWGLGYIRDRYGSPAAAWAHEQAFNWY